MSTDNAQPIISADFETLRTTAQQLNTSVEALEEHRKALDKLRADAKAEASVGTKTGSPAPVYSPLLQSLDAALDKIGRAIEQFQSNVASDAAALTKLANSLEQSTARGAQQVTTAGESGA